MKIKKQENKVKRTIGVFPSKWRKLKQKCKKEGYKITEVFDYLIDLFLKEKRR